MEEQANPVTQAAKRQERRPITQERWTWVSALPCVLSVDLPTPVTVGDVLDLEVGSVIRSHHSPSNPVPVWVNGVVIGRAEFDVAGKVLAVRITEVY